MKILTQYVMSYKTNLYNLVLSLRLYIPCPPYNYFTVLQALSHSSLADHKEANNITLFSNLLNGKINSATLLSLINSTVVISTVVSPRSTRFHVPFYKTHLFSNFLENSPITRLMRTANSDPTFTFSQKYFVVIITYVLY